MGPGIEYVEVPKGFVLTASTFWGFSFVVSIVIITGLNYEDHHLVTLKMAVEADDSHSLTLMK